MALIYFKRKRKEIIRWLYKKISYVHFSVTLQVAQRVDEQLLAFQFFELNDNPASRVCWAETFLQMSCHTFGTYTSSHWHGFADGLSSYCDRRNFYRSPCNGKAFLLYESLYDPVAAMVLKKIYRKCRIYKEECEFEYASWVLRMMCKSFRKLDMNTIFQEYNVADALPSQRL